jgi:hypothetical protein
MARGYGAGMAAVRMLALVQGLAGRAGRAARGSITTAWHLLGSRQARNLLLAIGLILAAHLAQRIERCEAHLDQVAEAQRIMGYATMTELEAHGLGPRRTTAPAPASAPAPTPAPVAVDPAALSAAPRSDASIPLAATAPAASPLATAVSP